MSIPFTCLFLACRKADADLNGEMFKHSCRHRTIYAALTNKALKL